MTTIAPCPKCTTPLPGDALFCPKCGTPTPNSINAQTGEVKKAAPSGADESEYRARLQRALGAGYELRGLIGQGGFGAVYAAWDVKLKREVAIKALRFDLFPTPELLKRFQREAEAVARLRHPNIIPIYSVGEGDGLAYMIMPRIEGSGLRDVLRREERLSVADACRMLLEAADGLQAAHDAGVVHRDVKPENILLDGPARRVQLMDFGIAKAMNAGETGLTGTGMIVGTPQYMSPEQASGERTVDHRSDQYSLAVVGYQMLTGDLPFEAESMARLIYLQVAGDSRPVHERRPDIPRAVSAVIQRAMAKDPAERYPDMKAFAAAIAAAAQAGAVVPDDGKDPVVAAPSKRLLYAGAAGLVAFLALYRVANPPPVAYPTVSEERALAIAADFLKQQGAVGSFREVAQYASDRDARIFLNRTLGIAGTRAWAEKERPLGRWDVRWFQPPQVEDWHVTIGGAGTIVSFTHDLDDAVRGATITQDSAAAVATAFLKARGWKVDSLERVEASSQQRANRTDHRFAWKKLGSDIPWPTGDSVPQKATQRVTVEVKGDRVTALRPELQLPPAYTQEMASRTSVRTAGGFAAFVAGVVLVLVAGLSRRGRAPVRWGLALRISGFILAGGVLGMLNGFPGMEASYKAGSAFWVDLAPQFLTLIVGLAILSCAAMVGLTVGDAALRSTLPVALGGYAELARGRFTSPAVTRSCVAGCAVASLLLGAQTAFHSVARWFPGVWRMGERGGYSDVLGILAPALYPVSDKMMEGLAGATVLLVTVATVTRFTRSIPLVLAAVGFLLGLIFTDLFPVYLGAIGTLMWWGILGVALVRLGWVACAVGIYVSSTLGLGAAMVTAPTPGVAGSGVVVLLLAALPLAPVAIARMRASGPVAVPS
jgi:serine/threonine-protein kinase